MTNPVPSSVKAPQSRDPDLVLAQGKDTVETSHQIHSSQEGMEGAHQGDYARDGTQREALQERVHASYHPTQ